MWNIFVFLIVLLSSCGFIEEAITNRNTHVRDEDYERIADKITSKFAKKMKAEKGLRCIGTGGGMMTDIQRMAISFQYFHEVNLDEARELLVSVVQEYLKAINGSKEVRPYLHEYPFRFEDIEIMIWIKEPNGNDVPLGKIAQITVSRGVVIYYSYKYDPGNSYQTLHRETYEEAVKIVNKEKVS